MEPGQPKDTDRSRHHATEEVVDQLPRDRRRAPRSHAARVERRFFMILIGVVVALIIGGTHTAIQINGVKDIAEESRVLNRKMHFFHQLHIAAQLVLSDRLDVINLVDVAARLSHDADVRRLIPQNQVAVADLINAALLDPEKYRSEVAQVVEHIADLHGTYDVLVQQSGAEFSAGIRNVHISLILTAVVTILLVAGPPLLFIRDLTSGIARLRMKVDMAEVDGDPTAVDLKRADEIGDVAREFDNMFRATRAREMERDINRQMIVEYQKMNDLISVAGGIAHEVGNPMASLVPQIDALEGRINDWRSRTGATEDFEIETGFDDVRTALGRIETLLRRISAFAIDPSGGGEELDVNEVLRTSVEMITLHDTARLITITQSSDDTVQLIRGSRPLLSMALFSLLGAAIRVYGDKPGELKLASASRPELPGVQLLIEASGELESDAVVAEMETTASVVANMLKSVGGTVEVVQGTASLRFVIALPLHAEDDGTDAPSQSDLKEEI